MPMSNSPGQTPYPPHKGMREMSDEDRPVPEKMPDCEQAMRETLAKRQSKATT